MTDDVSFPPAFRWGAATASYQIEGAVEEDGRGQSIWDTFCATPGKVRNGESGAIADDHYHRYRDDVALMQQLGLTAYRFSIAWPRIVPEGRGRVNRAGLDFYNRLVDALLAAGIEPYVTLYHWDLPQTLENQGGWLQRETAEAFAAYAETVARELGDRVTHWITLNEPWVSAWLGYGWGEHAPGLRQGEKGALQAAHHLLLGHGRAVQAIRAAAPRAELGITLNLTPFYPVSDSPEDRAAARAADGVGNRWFLDAIFKGRYPDDVVQLAEQQGWMPRVQQGDLEAVAAPLDFLGVNYYQRGNIRSDPDGKPVFVRVEGSEYTDMDWEVYPQGLFDLLLRLQQDYAPPSIYITENGAAYPDVRTHDGQVRDPERTRYLEQHLEAVGRAIARGVPVDGYFVWSLLDNFEWAHGYWKRFGIVYVDFPTLERIPKTSYSWYRSFIAEHAPARAAATAGGAE